MALQTVQRRRGKKKLSFEPDKVFDLKSVKKDDLEFDLDQEVARYRARKGEAGDRKSGPPPNYPPWPVSTGGRLRRMWV